MVEAPELEGVIGRIVKPNYYLPESGISTYPKGGQDSLSAPSCCFHCVGLVQSMRTHQTAPSSSYATPLVRCERALQPVSPPCAQP